MSSNLDIALDSKSVLGEGPIWDADTQTLYWVNIDGNTVNAFHPSTGENREHDLGQSVGTVVCRRSGGVVVATEQQFASVDMETGAMEVLAEVEQTDPPNRFNDGKCDPAGRFWCGTMPLTEDMPTGSLYCLHTDLTVTKHLDELTIANGIIWTADESTMYYIDTPTFRVDAFDYDVATGAISNRRTAVDVPKENEWPDGMAIDADGNIWVGHWGGWGVVCYDPRTGKQLRKIDVPASQVTACAFGGPNLSTLYITTARYKLSEADLADQPHAGSMFVVELDVHGVPSAKFEG